MTPREKFLAADAAYTRAAERYDRLYNAGRLDSNDWNDTILRAHVVVNGREKRYTCAREMFKRLAPKQYVGYLEQREDYLSRMRGGDTGSVR